MRVASAFGYERRGGLIQEPGDAASMMRGDLGWEPLGFVRLAKHLSKSLRLIGPGDEHGGVARGEQYARQQRNAPLIHFLDPNRRYQTFAIFEQGLARKQARGVR